VTFSDLQCLRASIPDSSVSRGRDHPLKSCWLIDPELLGHQLNYLFILYPVSVAQDGGAFHALIRRSAVRFPGSPRCSERLCRRSDYITLDVDEKFVCQQCLNVCVCVCLCVCAE